jgi:hypothetical protein
MTPSEMAAGGDDPTATPDEVARSQDDYERRVDGVRLRGLLVIAALANLGMVLYDALYVASGYPGRLAVLASCRLVCALTYAAARSTVPSEEAPPRRRLEAIRMALPVSLAAECVVMGLLSGGPESTFGAGAIIMPVALLPCVRPWRTNVAVALATVALYPLSMAVAGLVSPTVGAQLAAPRVAFRVFSDGVLSGLVGLVVVVATHYQWQLRREHFASKAVGRYVLRRLLGRGGMGEVWAAWHPTLRREVAVKLLAGLSGSDAMRRFEREVRATTELTHPNTVRIYDFGVAEDGALFYTMEKLEGVTLAELVAKEGPLPVERAVHLARQAAGALTEAHGRGIVHRDVKPENLFVATVGGLEDFVKVLDFGIAKGQGLADVTGTARIVGSLTTISPEAARGLPTTAASDVYSLGVSLYFALAGRYPFEDHTAGVLFAHVQRPPPPLASRRAKVPPTLAAIVHRCLEKDPAARFPSARELAQALEEFAGATAAAAPVDGTAAAAPVDGTAAAAPGETFDAALANTLSEELASPLIDPDSDVRLSQEALTAQRRATH